MGGQVNKRLEPITNMIKEKIAKYVTEHGKKPESLGVTVNEMEILTEELNMLPPFMADGVLITTLQ